ncbi:MAG: tRNA (guanosine(46)-N7)-methyltransferase TrmB [Dongiaceae bacterium]
MSLKNSANPAPVKRRVYGRKSGRLSALQKTHLANDLPRYIFSRESAPLDFSQIFGKKYNAYALEIGFGAGEHLLLQAQTYPETGFLGAEPFLSGVAKATRGLTEKKISNVRIFQDDARILLAALKEESLEHVYILFPDPWPKKRHHDRRIVSAEVIAEILRVLKRNGHLHLASDHESYRQWMDEVLAQFPKLKAIKNWSENEPELWGETRYQAKAKRAGRLSKWSVWKKS